MQFESHGEPGRVAISVPAPQTKLLLMNQVLGVAVVMDHPFELTLPVHHSRNRGSRYFCKHQPTVRGFSPIGLSLSPATPTDSAPRLQLPHHRLAWIEWKHLASAPISMELGIIKQPRTHLETVVAVLGQCDSFRRRRNLKDLQGWRIEAWHSSGFLHLFFDAAGRFMAYASAHEGNHEVLRAAAQELWLQLARGATAFQNRTVFLDGISCSI